MAANERIGFTIGADASEFQRELRGVTQEAERLEKIASEGGGLFATDSLRDYNEGLTRITRTMRQMQYEYRRATQEAARYQEELDDINKMGGTVSPEQSARMKGMWDRTDGMGSAIEDMRHRQGGLADGRQDLQQAAMRQHMVAQMALQHIPYAGSMYGSYNMLRGANFSKKSSLALSGLKGVAEYVTSNVMAGYSELMDQQMSRMVLERTLGVAPGRSGMGRAQRYGLSMGYRASEVAQFFGGTARATGSLLPANAISNMAMMRGYSLDFGTLTSMQSTGRHAGDKALADEMNRSMVRAFKAGGFSRPVMEEFIQSASSVLNTLSPGSTRATVRDSSALLAVMSRSLGGVYARSPLRTSGLIQRMGSGFSASGSDAELGFKLQAMGFGSDPNVDYVEGIRRVEEGPSARNIKRYLTYMRQWTGGDKRMTALGLYRIFGGSVKMHEALSLTNLDPSKLSEKNIDAQLKSQRVDIMGEAAKTRGGTALQRMDIAKRQQQAALTAQYMPMIEKMWQVSMTALKGTLAAGNLVINAANVTINAAKTASKRLFSPTVSKGPVPTGRNAPPPSADYYGGGAGSGGSGVIE